MSRQILCGNWKMNKTRADAQAFFSEFLPAVKPGDDLKVMFATPFTCLHISVEATKNSPVKILAQNVHEKVSGAYTGEVSVEMLKEVGCVGSLVGHSERRQYYGETDASVVAKTKTLLTNNMLAMVCVGESQEEREAGQTDAVVSRQVKAVLSAISDLDLVVFAYEPIWAIGTGLTATNDQAQTVHKMIRGLIVESHGENVAEKTPILYGGSAKPGNISGLIAESDIDGGLVGGASLKPEDFASMVNQIV